MVVIYKDKKIAIECDGERYHSGAEKIREDMERQTILERIGWQFIRIRGSEYYRNKTQTIENLIKSLNKLGIEPEQSLHQEQNSKKYDLLDREKERTNIIRQEWEEEQSQIVTEKSNIIVNNHPEQLTFVPIAKENQKQFDSYDNRISNMILKMKENYNKGNYLEALVYANKIIKIDANNLIAVTFRDNAKRKLLNSSISKWKTK